MGEDPVGVGRAVEGEAGGDELRGDEVARVNGVADDAGVDLGEAGEGDTGAKQGEGLVFYCSSAGADGKVVCTGVRSTIGIVIRVGIAFLLKNGGQGMRKGG